MKPHSKVKARIRILGASLLATFLIFGLHSPSWADEGAKKGGSYKERAEERFKKTDQNSDNFLTQEEMLDAHKQRLDKMFNRMDTDKDGKLSRDELKAGRDQMREKIKENRANPDSAQEPIE